MADSKKSGKGGSKKASSEAAEVIASKAEGSAAVSAREAPAKPAEKSGAHGAAHGKHDASSHKPNIKEYLVIFVVLAVLTALEVGVAQVPGVSKKLVALALVGLALTKAAIVGLYYMHLKHETRVLKLTVALPMAAPAIYAIVLISEAAWRLTRF